MLPVLAISCKVMMFENNRWVQGQCRDQIRLVRMRNYIHAADFAQRLALEECYPLWPFVAMLLRHLDLGPANRLDVAPPVRCAFAPEQCVAVIGCDSGAQ